MMKTHTERHLLVSGAAGFLVIMVGMASFAQAASVTLGFTNITNNNVTDAATAPQYSVIVSDHTLNSSDAEVSPLTDQVLFRFRNSVAIAYSSITNAYFQDGTLLGIASLSGSGVAFSEDANPEQLPGGNGFGFPPPTASFSMDSDNQPPTLITNGVDTATDFLDVLFNLQVGKSYADVLNALALTGSEELRIGIHVQGFDGGGSESFVNNGGNGGEIIPLPLAAWGGLMLMGGMGFSRTIRRRMMA